MVKTEFLQYKENEDTAPLKEKKGATCFVFSTKNSSGLEVSSFSKVSESQMVFELCWHLTESQHHGNNSKEQNTSQVLVDLLSGAPGALLIIGVKVEMVRRRSGMFLHRQTHPAVRQDANREW